MTIGERIKYRREELKMSQEELAHKLGYKSRSSINKIELGANNLTQSKIKAIADALDTTPSYIMGWDEPAHQSAIPPGFIPIPSTIKIPLVGTIACGVPILAEENIEGYVELPDNIHADFALRCKGDSMIGAGIQSGDIVYIREQPIVENGQIAAVMIDNEATLKRFYRYNDTVQLVAENPAVRPLVFVQEEINSLHIAGLAVGYTHKIVY